MRLSCFRWNHSPVESMSRVITLRFLFFLTFHFLVLYSHVFIVWWPPLRLCQWIRSKHFNLSITEQAVWCLGNMMSEDAEMRNFLLDEGFLKILVELAGTVRYRYPYRTYFSPFKFFSFSSFFNCHPPPRLLRSASFFTMPFTSSSFTDRRLLLAWNEKCVGRCPIFCERTPMLT